MSALTQQWAGTFDLEFQSNGPEWLDTLRRQAASNLADNGLPVRRDEPWKYTPMTKLEAMKPVIRGMNQAKSGVDVALPADDLLENPDIVIDLFDGVFSGCHGDKPAGLSVLSLQEALSSHESQLRPLIEAVDTTGSTNAFAALNTAFLEQGLVIAVAANANAGDILVRWTFSGKHDAGMHNFRVFVLMEPHSTLHLAEQFIDNAEQGKALNVITHVELSEAATLEHVRVQHEPDNTVLLSSTDVVQSARSTYRYSGFDFGGGLVRHQLASRLLGDGAHAAFNGAFVLDGERLVDNHVSVDHSALNCSSDQFFRGVLGGKSRGVWNGRALIEKGADGSSVRQSNANLLLSDLAEMDTKPELEIYADEVVASHGATVGQLDDIAIFYLRSRGLSELAARRILTGAFCRAVSDRLDNAEIKQHISGLIHEAMPEL